MSLFWEHFSKAKDELKDMAFSNEEVYKLAVETALRLVEVDMKEKEYAFNFAKIKTEQEIAALSANTAIQNQKIEALKNLVQAESMIRSVSDNAAIHKSNAMNSFLNVMGNASDPKGIAAHSTRVVNTINAINTTALAGNYTTLLNNVKAKLDTEIRSIDEVEKIQIIAAKTRIKKGEVLELFGFSLYPNNESYFEFNKQSFNGKNYFFTSQLSGEYEVFYRVRTSNNALISTSIRIKVED